MRPIIFETPLEKIDLSGLSAEFEFKWRVQSYSKFKKQAICVPYCDARQVADVLDRVCGIDGWQCKYEDIGGNTYCHIGINIGGEWVWKSDCGKESSIEKEKGEASDAFKRAGVKWGIGRFLYSMRTYTLITNKKKEQGDLPSHLHCLDDKGIRLDDWTITAYINNKRGSSQSSPAANPNSTGDEKTGELATIEEWAERRQTQHILSALAILGHEIDAPTFKREGLAALPRIEYATFGHLIQISEMDPELVEMALEGFGFADMKEALKAKAAEKILKECRLIKSQEPS